MRRRLLPILAVLFLVVPIASAGIIITIPFSEFNAGLTEHPTGYTSDTWTVSLVNTLNFSGPGSVAKLFIANSTGAEFYAINVNLAPELDNPQRYSMDFFIASTVDPGPDNWTHIGMIHNCVPGKAYYIRLDANASTFSVTDGNKVLLTNPVANPFPAKNIRTIGAEGTAVDGYVKVSVDKWAYTPVETVNAWLPIVLAFAMLGMALGLLRKMSK
ncbi:MAG: hypothetical protein WHS82_00795 [Candidatus Methanosuratincola sp.]